jgi:hypothetical protein
MSSVPAGYQHRAFCLGCGYALRGLPETRCPECGRGFDPRKPMTMRVPGLNSRPPPKPVPFGIAINLWALTATAVTTIGLMAGLWSPSVLGAMVWLGILVAWRRRNRWDRGARGWYLSGPRAWRPVVAALLILSLLSGIGHHRCPHGRYYRYGPVSVFHGVQAGGPCRNHVTGTRFELTATWYLVVS